MALFEREYAWEKQQYKVDKRIANLLCDMGFAIADQDRDKSKFHRLVKQTDKHLVIVTYQLRPRLICPPDIRENPEELKKYQERSFSHFLREMGMATADMVGTEEEELQAMKDEMETLKDPLEHKEDH